MLVVILFITLSKFSYASTQTEDGYEVDDMILSEKQVEWLQNGLLEGELAGWTADHNRKKINNYGQANALKAPDTKWPNNRVYYSFAKAPLVKLKQDKQEKVRQVLKSLEEKLDSCITFHEKNEGKRIIVKSYEPGCRSHVGYNPKDQMFLNLRSSCFDNNGTIEHEFLHALGIDHTQSRSDRNEHIKINYDNIEALPNGTISEKVLRNFNSYDSNTVSHYGLPYDYDSVMHYGKSAFGGIDERITIETLDSTKKDVIGQRDGVSKGDKELVKRAYRCPSAAVNGGYTEWSTFDECSKRCGEGEGTQTWYRTCTNPEPRHNKDFKGLTCEEQNLGPAKETRACNLGPCAVNGGYNQWSEFGSCSNTCGDGTQSKYRTCTNPQPQYNGLTCEEQNLGPDTETKACNLGQCAVNGGYTEWRALDECSKACGEGEGTQTWHRTCTNPEPRHNKHFKGLTCEEQNLGPAKETRTCNLGQCVWDLRIEQCRCRRGYYFSLRRRRCTRCRRRRVWYMYPRCGC